LNSAWFLYRRFPFGDNSPCKCCPTTYWLNVLIAAPGPWLRKVSKRRRRGRASASRARIAEATTRELLGRQAHFLRRQPPRGWCDCNAEQSSEAMRNISMELPLGACLLALAASTVIASAQPVRWTTYSISETRTSVDVPTSLFTEDWATGWLRATIRNIRSSRELDGSVCTQHC
jgi:hypothetical protein